MVTFLEFFDHFGVDGGDVVGVAAGDDALVHDDCWSTHSAPLRVSSCFRLGQLVIFRPLLMPVSLRLQGPCEKRQEKIGWSGGPSLAELYRHAADRQPSCAKRAGLPMGSAGSH